MIQTFKLALIPSSVLTLVLMSSVDAHALTVYSNETDWQAAVPNFSIEDFDAIPNGTGVSGLPSLGITFDDLAPGLSPMVGDLTGLSAVPRSTPNSMANFTDFALSNVGDLTVRAAAGLRGFAYWAVGGDGDVHRLSFYDEADVLIENSITVIAGISAPTFVGVTADVLIHRITIDIGLAGNPSGNQYFAFDDMQTSVVPVPPAIMLLFSGGILLIRRRRGK